MDGAFCLAGREAASMGVIPHEFMQFLHAIPLMSIDDGMVHFEPQDGTPRYVMPLSVFRAAHRHAGAMLAAYDATPGNVIDMPRPVFIREFPPQHD